jgi:predicted regulator of Ras-like GTPase activity (Roadblock/LC7/MglB family)
MQVPFLDLYLKLRDKVRALRGSATIESEPAPRSTIAVAKPEGERLSKTVLPNMTRKIAAPESVSAAAGVMSPPQGPIQTVSRARSVASPTAAWSWKSPGAIALGEEPKTDRSISIRLGDILNKLPVGSIKSRETIDCDRHILLRASEIEKGMSEGKPTVALASIYQQVPEIFVQRPTPDDSTEVALPFQTILAQLMTLQVRSDQVRDDIVPQVETPILQVTLEDTERFGTTIEPLQTSPLPPVRVEAATAKSIAAAQPEATVSEKVKPRVARPVISLIDPPLAKREPPPPNIPLTPPPRPKIPIDLPPNGTGESASEIVPALSGPPVPTVSPPPIPVVPSFRVTAPSEDIRPKFIRIPGTEPREEAAFASKVAAAREGERKIALSLPAVLHELPAFQLNGSPVAVPEDARVELPLSLIEPQLASGRVVVSPTLLQKAMPEDYRALLKIDPVETPIVLPLQEVLKNLPAGVLRMRPDQEEVEIGEEIETTFSIKAEEDAKRFRGEVAAVVEPAEPPTEPAVASEKSQPSVPNQPSAPSQRNEPSKPQPEEKLDDKVVLAHANALPGVASCAILFADGLALAGKLPAELNADGLCAMLPSVLQKIDKHLLETKLGALSALTLHVGKAPLTFIQRGKICLAALHAESELPSASRDQLVSMVEQLSNTYSEEEPAHVDH